MLHQDSGQLQQVTQITCQLFKSLRLMVYQKKSVLMPTQELGLSSVLSNNKAFDSIRKIQQDVKNMLTQESSLVREKGGLRARLRLP